MAITKKQLDLAGWFSITNALIAIPSLAMSWFLETVKGIGPRLSQAILTVVGLGLFLYVIHSLRRLLNDRFKFHDCQHALRRDYISVIPSQAVRQG